MEKKKKTKETVMIAVIIAVLAACAIYVVPKAVKAYKELDKKTVDLKPEKTVSDTAESSHTSED